MINIAVLDKEVREKIQQLVKDEDKLIYLTTTTAIFAEQKLKGQAKEESVTSKTHNSIGYEISRLGGRIVARVGSKLPYYPNAMEYGRGPGRMPPVNALRTWARRRLGNENLAFAVARKIATGSRRRNEAGGTSKFRNGGPKRVTMAFKEFQSGINPILAKAMKAAYG